jgi:hypothetical protein
VANTGEIVAGAVALAVVGGVAYYVTRPTTPEAPALPGTQPGVNNPFDWLSKLGSAPTPGAPTTGGAPGSGPPALGGRGAQGDLSPDDGDAATRAARLLAVASRASVRAYMQTFTVAGAGRVPACMPEQSETTWRFARTPFIASSGECRRTKAVRGFFLLGQLWTLDYDASQLFDRSRVRWVRQPLSFREDKRASWVAAYKIGPNGAPVGRVPGRSERAKYPTSAIVSSFLTDTSSNQACAWDAQAKRWLAPDEWQFFAPRAVWEDYVVPPGLDYLRRRVKVQLW